MRRVYFDNAATTRIRPEAKAALDRIEDDTWGNPSGQYREGKAARELFEHATDSIKRLLNRPRDEVTWTGSATQALNLAIQGLYGGGADRIVCSAIEHDAVYSTANALGCTVVRVEANGLIDLGDLYDKLNPSVHLVCVMLVNNVVGTIQPIDKVAAIVRERVPDALLLVDAVQAASWLDVATAGADADLLVLSGHKVGGPKGVGVLIAREGVRPERLIYGGGQQGDRWSGTEAVGLVVAMEHAYQATVANLDETVRFLEGERNRLADGLLAAVPDSAETGDRVHKVAGICHLSFGGGLISSKDLLDCLDVAAVAASATSACSAGHDSLNGDHGLETSLDDLFKPLGDRILNALGIPLNRAALRLSLGWATTANEVDYALEVVPQAVASFRETGRCRFAATVA